MRPLRRKQTCQVTQNPVTGQDRILAWMQEEHILSDQGSTDSANLQRQFFLDCGCSKPAQGRCYECGAISCEVHHGICQKCQKPICMEHSHFLEMENHGEIRLCRRCHDKFSRKNTRAKIGKFFLSLIVQVGEQNER